MENPSQQVAGVFVEVRSASKDDAYHLGGFTSTKWAQPARVWVRSYDEAGRKTSEELIGFIDKRHTGPRSRAYGVLKFAREYADKLRAAANHQRGAA
ncbi:hypothetical protein HDG40_005659 [Paraburkholderia sp. JPY158]|uniref:Uncharacterized protein n=1 Tax=Paraburkholderia atlantica TaxID=2654982 RepID=A0A7W8V968_PARAM|nr:hypothetical protein [Paraburkholderia atlantica]MBB5427480.1 hypothetical protein [Paraburkholderia atlantica]